MDLSMSAEEKAFDQRVRTVLEKRIQPEYSGWAEQDTTPKRMFEMLGNEGLLGFRGTAESPRPIPWLQNICF